MKRVFLTLLLFILITSSTLRAQQAHGFVVLNYSPGTCKVQVEYWLNNPTGGNGSMYIAVADVGFQWDSTMFTMVRDSSVMTGLNLTDIYPGHPDLDSFSQRTVNGSNFRTLDMLRSTDSCNRMYSILPGETKPLGLVVLQFRNCNDANAYNFTDTSASNYIADVNDGVTNPTKASKILIIVNKSTRPFDASGSKCNGAVGSINNVPLGDTNNNVFIPQAPLLVNKLKSFSAFKHNNHAELIWEIATNTDTKEFGVERKLNYRFETISYIRAGTQYNNITGSYTYMFTDPDILSTGITYYRIRQVNLSGIENYSEIKAVRNSKQLQVFIYPNPGNGSVNIILPDGNNTTDINMIDFSGKLIRSWNGIKTSNIKLTRLQKGLYTLLISSRETGEKVAQKITVQ